MPLSVSGLDRILDKSPGQNAGLQDLPPFICPLHCSAVLLLLCAPVFAMLAPIIRKDGGPVFFPHKRVGDQRTAFDCLKFCTMVPNAQTVLDHLLQTDPAAREEWQRDFKLKNDPRITPIGKFLRRSSLGALPQLWNILNGEMSLVGPDQSSTLR